MEDVERRSAQRYPIRAKAIVCTGRGEVLPAASLNISSSGVLVYIDPLSPLTLGEDVVVEVELPQEPEGAISSWAIGKVVRVDGPRSAIQLFAGGFDSLPEKPEDAPSH